MTNIINKVDIDLVESNDIWCSSSAGINPVGFIIGVATQSPVHHAGQILIPPIMSQALLKGIVEDDFTKELRKNNVVIIRIDPQLFQDRKEKEKLQGEVRVKAHSRLGMKYDLRMIWELGWRCGLRMLGLWRIKKVNNLLDQKRTKVVCSVHVDDCNDPIEKAKNIDLFIAKFHPEYTTPKDILKSPYVVFITGYKEFYDAVRKGNKV